MELIDKSKIIQNICGIEIDASAQYRPSAENSLQPFSNTFISTTSAKPVYFGKGKVAYAQQGKPTSSGMLYSQVLSIQFPNSDLLSSERIKEYIKVKLIYIRLSAGVVILFGRNDFYQNAAPVVTIKNTQNITKITYKAQSMFPAGQTNGSLKNLLPGDFPINFYNL